SWIRRLNYPLICFASGWMQVRQRAKQRGVELPLILSDHADWDDLLATITEIAPKEVWVTHGREEALIHACEMRGITAKALSIIGYDEAET
ncbi:MAG: MBL fold metallo-hydrolase RNA specificity domain-containing protein, partial [Pseudomonadota bacterium]|nr:MBL fold metallo-hydrolase RNA specificity domain-containing protein [Pseudomonadota bacterium]